MPTESGVSRRRGGHEGVPGGYTRPRDDEPADLSRCLPGLPLGGKWSRPRLGPRRAGESRPYHRRPARGPRAPRASMARQARRGPDLLVRRARRADRPLCHRAPRARGGTGRPGRGFPAPRPRDADRDDRHVEGGGGVRADLHRIRPGRGGVPGAPRRGPRPGHAPRAPLAPAGARAARRHRRHGRRRRRSGSTRRARPGRRRA
jgi:hypothetical protein